MDNIYDILSKCSGFGWDEHNAGKNRIGYGVVPTECEEIFFNQPLVIAVDEKHSIKEKRYYALGRTDADRHLFAVFTVRGKDLRIISARDMNRKEKKAYEEHDEEDS